MFGKLIKEYRNITGKTQEDIACLLDIISNHLSRIERGITCPSGVLINKIIDIITSDSSMLTRKITKSSLVGIVLVLHINELPPDKRELVYDLTLHYINSVKPPNKDR